LESQNKCSTNESICCQRRPSIPMQAGSKHKKHIVRCWPIEREREGFSISRNNCGLCVCFYRCGLLANNLCPAFAPAIACIPAVEVEGACRLCVCVSASIRRFFVVQRHLKISANISFANRSSFCCCCC